MVSGGNWTRKPSADRLAHGATSRSAQNYSNATIEKTTLDLFVQNLIKVSKTTTFVCVKLHEKTQLRQKSAGVLFGILIDTKTIFNAFYSNICFKSNFWIQQFVNSIIPPLIVDIKSNMVFFFFVVVLPHTIFSILFLQQYRKSQFTLIIVHVIN